MASSRRPAAWASDPGREREGNEDRVLFDPERGIFGVIDGVGGESGGEVAAEMAREAIHRRLANRTSDPERLVREAIALANEQIWRRAKAEPELAGMSCVLTVTVLDGTQATVGHVGDSRLYLLRPGDIRKVTHDHSPVGALEEEGALSEAEAMRHPRRNEIFRDVGSAPHDPDEERFIDVLRLPLDAESALLVCSDGLSDMLPSARIRELIEHDAGRPQAAVDALVEAANEAGGKDNVSVVLVAGERYAEAVRRASAAARGPVRGAAVAGVAGVAGWGAAAKRGGAASSRTGAGRTGTPAGPASGSGNPPPPRRSRGGALLALLALLLAAAALVAAFREPLLARFGGNGPAPRDVLLVGPGEEEFGSIAEALAAARPGHTVEVSPGDYAERLRLVDGVALVSRVPRAAVLRPPAGGGTLPVVAAEGVSGARLAGFRIEGGAGAPLGIGLRLADSAIAVEGIEVRGATVAGVEIAGGGRAVLRESYVHDNRGVGVLVTGGAAPRLLLNLIARNGRGAPPRPGVEVAAGSRAALIGNRILDNGGPQVRLGTAEAVDEVFGWNEFGAAARAEAVRAAGEPAASPAGTGRPR